MSSSSSSPPYPPYQYPPSARSSPPWNNSNSSQTSPLPPAGLHSRTSSLTTKQPPQPDLSSYHSSSSTTSTSTSSAYPYPEALSNLGYPTFSSDPRPLPATRTVSSLGTEKDVADELRERDEYDHKVDLHGGGTELDYYDSGDREGGAAESWEPSVRSTGGDEAKKRKMTVRRAVGEAAKGSTSGWKTLIPGSLVTRLYVGLVVLQTVVDMAIEGNLLIQFLALDTTGPLTTSSSAQSLRLPVYLGIFAVAHLFMLIMAIDAVKARNTIQIAGLCIFNALFLVYAIIQIDEIRQAFDGTDSDDLSTAKKIPVTLLTALIPSMIGACEIGYLVLSWFCWTEMGWDIYKSMGADRRLKKLFFHYQIFLCICKFSFFFFLGFSIQLIYLVLKRDWEYYLTLVALPFSLLLLLLGWLSARFELRSGMAVFTGAMIVLAAYYSLKLFRIWEETETLLTIVKSLTVFAVLSLALLVMTFIYTIIVWRGFGLGLKEGLDRKTQNDNEKKHGGLGAGTDGRYPLGSTQTKRMSIE